MPTIIQCPSCERRLRVPDNLLGRSVKCPTCQTTFTAGDGGETEEPPAEESPPVVARRRPAAPPPDEDEGYEEERPSRTSGRRRLSEEENYEQEDEDYEEERPRRRRRRRRRTAEAAGAVAGPAIALLIVGVLGLLVWAVNFVFLLVDPNAGANPFGGPNGNAPHDAGFKVGQIIGATAVIFWPLVVIGGAIQMKRLQSYGLAMTAAIVAMLPCNLCCLLGLPFGIWALVVLARDDVKRAFS